MTSESQKISRQKCYRGRIESGRCPRCGRVLDREGMYCSVCTSKQREYRRQSKIFFEQNGLCTFCGKNKVFGGEKTCPECRAKRAKYRKPATEEQKKKNRERAKIRWNKRKEQGLCAKCGKYKAVNDRVFCRNCLDRHSELERQHREEPKRYMEKGLCRCGKPRIPGTKLCADCYKQCCESLKKAREVRSSRYFKKLNDYWFGENGEGYESRIKATS